MSTVLVVDDEADIREVMDLMLSGAGHRVRTEPDGRGALTALAEESFDLVLLDRTMPGLDGIEVLQELEGSTRTVPPVLMVSALSSRDDLRAAVDAGAVGLLGKPFTRAELLGRVDELTVEPHPPTTG
ncbi:response regulator transcription factor [Nocardioides bruguierae]|uniref:response regulator transcription factor n=1 Tax=Nocardioides bruguierae TaxID=2945102 RepID=UPI00201FB6B6|nr:response regulator transcription factor [Nocardioides bruguierae]MCL8025988.1 response regulator transcription factor [Nocardioides bruguierae]